MKVSRAIREKLLKDVRRMVIKIGSRVLASDEGGLEVRHIQRLAEDICEIKERGYEVVLVTSGAIAAGVKKMGLKGRPRSIPEKQAAAAVGQARLMWVYERSFGRKGAKVAQLLLTKDDLINRGRFLNARNTLLTLTRMGVVPIINENDTVAIEEIKFGDNDNLSALVTNLVHADLLINLTDIEGLFNADPKRVKGARMISLVKKIDSKIERYAEMASNGLGTGGMVSKLSAARIAGAFGVPMIIANGKRPHMIREIMEARNIGTLILPKEDRISSWKHWIAYTLSPRGSLIVDNGAKKVLREKGKSLLPSGIIEVIGDFGIGEAVSCAGGDGKEFARGLVNYNSSEIYRIKGEKTSKIEAILGYKYHDEVIHRDDLVLI